MAQQIALVRPGIVRRLVLASAAPQVAASMHGWAAEVIGAVGTPPTSPEAYLSVFFAGSDSSGTPVPKRCAGCTPGPRTGTPPLLAGLIPQVRVKIYPDSAHGFLFQHHAEFAADLEAFLDAAS